jgi:ABC-type multidrug transport system permease subunit
MFTGINGMDLFNKGLLSDTGNRARISPIRKPALIGGLLAASTITGFLQGMVTFVFTAAVYGVYWGERIPLVLTTLFAVVLFSQSMCIFLLMVFRNMNAASGFAQVLIWSMTFVSKGYAKMSFGPLEEAFKYAPNSMAQTVIFGAVFGGNEVKMMLSLFILLGLGIVLFILAFLFGKRRLSLGGS